VSVDWLLSGDGTAFSSRELDIERYRLALALIELARRAETASDLAALQLADSIVAGQELVEALSGPAVVILESCLVDKSYGMTAAISYSQHSHILDSQEWAVGIVRNARIQFKMTLPLKVRQSLSLRELMNGVRPGSVNVSGGTDGKGRLESRTESQSDPGSSSSA